MTRQRTDNPPKRQASVAHSASKAARKWRPAPPGLIEDFEAIIRFIPDAEQRKMFGYPSAFVNGKLFAGLFQDRMVLKLPSEARSEFLKLPGAQIFEPIPGRVMQAFVLVPPALVGNTAKLRPWLKRAHAYVRCELPSAKRKKK